MFTVRPMVREEGKKRKGVAWPVYFGVTRVSLGGDTSEIHEL